MIAAVPETTLALAALLLLLAVGPFLLVLVYAGAAERVRTDTELVAQNLGVH